MVPVKIGPDRRANNYGKRSICGPVSISIDARPSSEQSDRVSSTVRVSIRPDRAVDSGLPDER